MILVAVDERSIIREAHALGKLARVAGFAFTNVN